MLWLQFPEMNGMSWHYGRNLNALQSEQITLSSQHQNGVRRSYHKSFHWLRKKIPHLANGETKIEVKHFLNNRYDVGLWCDAIQSVPTRDFDEIGVINDSVFALRPFTGVFDAIRRYNVSLTSLSYSESAKYNKGFGPGHFWVESIFRGFTKEGIDIFQEHSCVPEDHPFFCPTEEDQKPCIINNFEHDLVNRYPCNRVYGLFPSDSPVTYVTKNPYPTWVKNADYWIDLVERAGFPVAKVKEEDMITDLSSPLLSRCTRYIDDSLKTKDSGSGIDFELAKPYHLWPWEKTQRPASENGQKDTQP